MNVRKPLIDPSVFKKRRERLSKLLNPDSAVIVPSHPELIRNNDAHYDYRQDSSLFYLTGFEEPGSVLVMRPGQNPETVLFVRPRNPERETWDGFRFGPERAKSAFGLDEVFSIDDIDKKLPELLGPIANVYYRLLQNQSFDQRLSASLEIVRQNRGRSALGLPSIIDSSVVIGEMRVIKGPEEIEWMQKAADIASEAHINAMRFTRPGVTERQVQAVLQGTFLMRDSQRIGYNPIVASGPAATTLHYVFNDQPCEDGDLLLIDAGTEWNYYTSDITRTFPVNGKFSPAQRDLYQAVLSIQQEIIPLFKPGTLHKELQAKTVERTIDVLLNLKLLKGSHEEILDKSLHRKYYPHGVSHFLGLDVHDAGLYAKGTGSRPLEAGMALTVEPGIYVPADDESAPEEMRGLGVRIEDDLIVTSGAPLNLTKSCPKSIDEIEKLVGTGITNLFQ